MRSADAPEVPILGWTSHKLPIAAGVAQGLAFLHEQEPPIIHRDIKPENILLDNDLRSAKIGDLGLCRQLLADQPSSVGVGTCAFSAPEQIMASAEDRLGASTYDVSADIWSFGCVLACMDANRTSPYDDQQMQESDLVYFLASVPGARPPNARPLVSVTSPFYQLVSDCCQDASKRPTSHDLVGKLLARAMADACEAAQQKA